MWYTQYKVGGITTFYILLYHGMYTHIIYILLWLQRARNIIITIHIRAVKGGGESVGTTVIYVDYAADGWDRLYYIFTVIVFVLSV